MARPTHCPTCNSPVASRFPATAFEGEALACPDEWHLTDRTHPPTDTMRELVERGRRNRDLRKGEDDIFHVLPRDSQEGPSDEPEVPARAAELAALARWRRFCRRGDADIAWSSLPEALQQALIASSRLDLRAVVPVLRGEWLEELQMEAEERLEGFKMSAEAAAFEAGCAKAEAEDDAALAALAAVAACLVAAASVAAMVRMWRRG